MFSIHRKIDGQYYVWANNPVPGVSEGWKACGPAFSAASAVLGDVDEGWEAFGSPDIIFFFSDLQACRDKAQAISLMVTPVTPVPPGMGGLKALSPSPIKTIEIWDNWGYTLRRRRVLLPIG